MFHIILIGYYVNHIQNFKYVSPVCSEHSVQKLLGGWAALNVDIDEVLR